MARLYLSNFNRNLFIGSLLWGDEIQMSSLHKIFFLSADNSKSRRCLELTLKVVVAIYVVENKIGGSYTIHY
jgi:hypothetical protein